MMLETSVYTYLPKLIAKIVSRPRVYKSCTNDFVENEYLNLFNTEYMKSIYEIDKEDFSMPSIDIYSVLDHTWKIKIRGLTNITGVTPFKKNEINSNSEDQIFMLVPDFRTINEYNLVIMGNPILECVLTIINKNVNESEERFIYKVLYSLKQLYSNMVNMDYIKNAPNSGYCMDGIKIRNIIVSALTISTLKQISNNINELNPTIITTLSSRAFLRFLPEVSEESSFGTKKQYDSIKELSDYFYNFTQEYPIKSISYIKFLTDVFNIIYTNEKSST